MKVKQSRIVAGVEIGTSKVVALLGEVIDGSSLNLIGMGQCTAHGMRKGAIEDISAVRDCVHAALQVAEKEAGANCETAYLTAPSPTLQGFASSGRVNVASPDNVVEAEDIQRAVREARSKTLPDKRAIVHHVRTGYLLDGRPVNDPYQMIGRQLEVTYWHVHAESARLQDALRIINGYDLNVADMVISSIAAGSVCATEEQKKSGCLVVDLGAGTTDYALYREGRVQRTGIIPVGGDHLTNDLAIGLRVNAKQAESLKQRCAKAIIDREDKGDVVFLHGDLSIGDRPIPRLAIYKIAQARTEEIFMILKNKLGSALSPAKLPGGVILTGGGSRLCNIAEAAHNTLGVEIEVGENLAVPMMDQRLKQAEYSAVLGLLYHALADQGEVGDAPANAPGFMGKVARLFRLGVN